ncbi:MAG TPA: TonB-dependent receptor [Arachidicoccus sp.]|nr:TonB-dependent receptor [Arachidicoccus sp.]
MKNNSSTRKSVMAICLLLFCQLAFGQAGTITGSVTDAITHQALQGASVQIKGTQVGVTTDGTGAFSLSATSGDLLEVSYAGYITRTIPVNQTTTYQITLSPKAGSLDEVVVIGYGTQKRKDITSSIATLDNQTLASTPRANVGAALQGAVPGVQVINRSGTPGSSPNIILRGGASINAPGNPLVVVDGTIREFNDIASGDIASVEILKDASATAIYGARANNGVILITTKQGKAGSAQLTYKFTGGYNQNRKDYQYLNAHDYIFYNRTGNLNSGRSLKDVNKTRGYGLLTDIANMSSFDIRKLDNTNRDLLSQGWSVMADPYNADGMGRTDSILYKDHVGEIRDLVFRNTYTKDHYLSAMGGNDKGKYFASFDYYNEDGIIVGSSYKRYTGTINGSYKIKPNLEVSSGVNLSTASQYGIATSDANVIYRSMALWPTFNPWLDSAKTKPNPGVGVSDGNPLYWLQKIKRTNTNTKITANAAIKWSITPDLYIKGTASAYYNDISNQSYAYPTSNYSDLFAGRLSSYTRDAYDNSAKEFQQQYNAVANYTKSFNDLHHLSVMLGTEYYGVKYSNLYIHGQNAPTDDIITANASTVFPADGSNGSTESEMKIISTFGRLTYDFDQRYLFTAVFRSDAVSSLARENRVGYFPGFSAGWNIHQEKFFKNSTLSNFITTLKPRVSYGVNGNIAGLGNYEVQGTYGSQGSYNGTAGFLSTGLVNGGLRWEKSKTTDLGLDASFLQNKINFTFDYYNRVTSDLLTSLTLPSYVGYGSIRTNLGTLQNRGYEFSAQANIISNPSGWSLSLGANASYVKNKILKLPFNGNEKNRQGGIQIWDPNKNALVWVGGYQEGQSLGDVYAFKQEGIFKDAAEVAAIAGNRYDGVANISGPNLTSGSGKITPGDVNWMDVDRNDTIDTRDQVKMGNIFPKWTGGFNTNVSYKQFSLYARFDFALNYIIYNDLMARTLGNYQGTFNYLDIQKQSWTQQNPATDIPKVYYADQVSAPLGKKNYTRVNNANANLNSNNSLLYEPGGYLACREITLAYNFSREFLAKTKIFKEAKIYVSGSNLFYITDFSGPSPEPPTSGNTLTGVYLGSYPVPRTFVLGVQISL